MLTHNSGIYKLISPSNRIYIGQSLNLSKRLSNYRNGRCTAQRYIHAAIKKYGFDQFKVEILVYVKDKLEMNCLERFFIRAYNTTDKSKGYNIHSGGNSEARSCETKTRLSKALTGRKLSLNHRSAISKAKMKAVVQMQNGSILNTYSSVYEAACATGAKSISRCLQGKRRTCAGFQWKYKDSLMLTNSN